MKLSPALCSVSSDIWDVTSFSVLPPFSLQRLKIWPDLSLSICIGPCNALPSPPHSTLCLFFLHVNFFPTDSLQPFILDRVGQGVGARTSGRTRGISCDIVTVTVWNICILLLAWVSLQKSVQWNSIELCQRKDSKHVAINVSCYSLNIQKNPFLNCQHVFLLIKFWCFHMASKSDVES